LTGLALGPKDLQRSQHQEQRYGEMLFHRRVWRSIKFE
jgi:hypothetical protein